jgi:hypothetical protein
MMRWTSARSIEAPTDVVFGVVSDPVEFQRAVGGDPNVEYLTPQRAGVGTKFRARRTHKGRPMAFDQEVTQLAPGRSVRMVNVTHAVVWESTFEVGAAGAGSTLTLTMTAESTNPLRRLLMRLIAPMVQKALDKDMDATKAYAEGKARGGGGAGVN